MGFQMILQDITKLEVDAIVNAANITLLGGGGVDGAIHRAAGPELLEECRNLHGCRTGEAKLTKGYRLKAKYVIHTAGPVWIDGEQNEPTLLELCYKNSLRLAEANGCKSVAFPSISTGAYRFPVELAAEIAVREIRVFLTKSSVISDVTMACFDKNTLRAYERADGLMRGLR